MIFAVSSLLFSIVVRGVEWKVSLTFLMRRLVAFTRSLMRIVGSLVVKFRSLRYTFSIRTFFTFTSLSNQMSAPLSRFHLNISAQYPRLLDAYTCSICTFSKSMGFSAFTG